MQNLLCIAVLLLTPWTGTLLFHSVSWITCLHVLAGTLAMVMGARRGLAGVRDLGVNRTSNPVPLPEGQLITRGIYARMRHPLYSSLMHLTFGWSLFWGSAVGLMMSLGLSLVLMGKAMREEKLLRVKFPGYREYEQRVRRF